MSPCAGPAVGEDVGCALGEGVGAAGVGAGVLAGVGPALPAHRHSALLHSPSTLHGHQLWLF